VDYGTEKYEPLSFCYTHPFQAQFAPSPGTGGDTRPQAQAE